MMGEIDDGISFAEDCLAFFSDTRQVHSSTIMMMVERRFRSSTRSAVLLVDRK